jgi:hypothetical protein
MVFLILKAQFRHQKKFIKILFFMKIADAIVSPQGSKNSDRAKNIFNLKRNCVLVKIVHYL